MPSFPLINISSFQRALLLIVLLDSTAEEQQHPNNCLSIPSSLQEDQSETMGGLRLDGKLLADTKPSSYER